MNNRAFLFSNEINTDFQMLFKTLSEYFKVLPLSIFNCQKFRSFYLGRGGLRCLMRIVVKTVGDCG